MKKPGRKSSVTVEAKVVKVYSKGDLVFAKLRGYPAWPARIDDVTENEKNPALNKYRVFFYGTHQTSNCKHEDLQLYAEISEMMKNSCKKKGFIAAMEEIEDNPNVTHTPIAVPKAATPTMKKRKKSLSANHHAEEEEEEDDSGSSYKSFSSGTEEEEEEVTPSPKKKIKTPKVLKVKMVKGPTKSTATNDNGPGPSKKRKTTRESTDSAALSDSAPNSSKIATSGEDLNQPNKLTDDENDEVDWEKMFVEYKEPEDENMPEDERIVRRLVRSSIWVRRRHNEDLKTLLRGMRLHFSEEKIKNWDQSELLEMIESERKQSIAKITECPLLKLDLNNLDINKAINDMKKDDDGKDDGTYIKYLTRHKVDTMRQIQNLTYTPELYRYIVQLATKNPENDFTLDSQLLSLDGQKKLFCTEEKFIMMAEELARVLPQEGEKDVKTAIALLENLCKLELTNIMLYKNVTAVHNIYNLSKYNLESDLEDLSDEDKETRRADNKQIKQKAQDLIEKFKELVLPDDWEDCLPPSPEKNEEKASSNENHTSESQKSTWLLYDTIREKNRIMVKAAEGNDEDFSRILQEPIDFIVFIFGATIASCSYWCYLVLAMNKYEYTILKSLSAAFKKSWCTSEKEAAFRISILARSLHPFSDVPTEEFPSVMLRKKIEVNGNSEETDVVDNCSLSDHDESMEEADGEAL